MEPLFFEKNKQELKCVLCPHYCSPADGRQGLCGVRGNQDGKASLPYQGMLSAISLDPIEKKPLYHFYPGEATLSVGFYGCNMSCPFCQNFHISKTLKKADVVSPEEIIESCVAHKSRILSFTYSEPLVHFEWVLETAQKAKAAGLKTVLVTNGLINPEPATLLCKYIDASNIDLKTWNPETYARILKGDLETVKNTIRIFASKHLEITSLVVPGLNDSVQDILLMAQFIASINPDIPFHLSAYHPDYNYHEAPVEMKVIREMAQKARSVLHFVYEGNTGRIDDTVCWNCGKKIVQNRGGFGLVIELKNGNCPACGKNQNFCL